MKRQGLTLLELLVALLVCAMILIVGQTLLFRLLANDRGDRDRAELVNQMDFALTQMAQTLRSADGLATGETDLNDDGPLPTHRLIVCTTATREGFREGGKKGGLQSLPAAYTFDVGSDRHGAQIVRRALSLTRFSEEAPKVPLTADLGRRARMQVAYYDREMRPTGDRAAVRFVKVELRSGPNSDAVVRYRMMALPERRKSDGQTGD